MLETKCAPSISISSSRAGRRPCLKTLALPEDPAPRIPWRVLSLPTPVLARDNQEARDAKEDPPYSKIGLDNGSTGRVGGENIAVCSMRSSKNGAQGRVEIGRAHV